MRRRRRLVRPSYWVYYKEEAEREEGEGWFVLHTGSITN